MTTVRKHEEKAGKIKKFVFLLSHTLLSIFSFSQPIIWQNRIINTLKIDFSTYRSTITRKILYFVNWSIINIAHSQRCRSRLYEFWLSAQCSLPKDYHLFLDLDNLSSLLYSKFPKIYLSVYRIKVLAFQNQSFDILEYQSQNLIILTKENFN